MWFYYISTIFLHLSPISLGLILQLQKFSGKNYDAYLPLNVSKWLEVLN